MSRKKGSQTCTAKKAAIALPPGFRFKTTAATALPPGFKLKVKTSASAAKAALPPGFRRNVQVATVHELD